MTDDGWDRHCDEVDERRQAAADEALGDWEEANPGLVEEVEQ